MMTRGCWRWPLITFLTLLAGGGLLVSGLFSLKYEGDIRLRYAGDPNGVDEELVSFKFHPVIQSTIERVPGNPTDVQIRLHARWPGEVVRLLNLVGQTCIDRSLGRQKGILAVSREQSQTLLTQQEARTKALMDEKASAPVITRAAPNRAALAAQLQELKSRRRLLIERYPTHSDIPVLAKRIQEVQAQMNKSGGSYQRLAPDFHRRWNESLYRQSTLTKRLAELDKASQELKSLWSLSMPARKPKWPIGAEGWLIGLPVMGIVFALCFLFIKGGNDSQALNSSAQGLWRPEVDVPEKIAEVAAPEPIQAPEEIQAAPAEEMAASADIPMVVEEAPLPVEAVELEIVKPDLPSDPLTEKAAELYAKWVELAHLLYSPAVVPPQGVLEQVGPLLQQSTDFLPEGHEVLAKYLARSVEPGNLSAHVARTVLMTLTGAREAGVTPEHQLAMALAALFHDLAMVSRPAAIQSEIGSEVGRLSASVLRRIPGLPAALITMVEDILIGMDEYKLDTWQNSAAGKNLEPLSKVLREIDRFEKVMQKQKARIERRVANQ